MSQDLSKVSLIAIHQAVSALRANAVTPNLVMRDIALEAGQRNQRIDVPIYNNLAAQQVTAGSNNTASELTPRVASVTLDQWYEVRFAMSDREMAEVMDGALPAVMERAVKALADNVDKKILADIAKRAAGGNVDVGSGIASDPGALISLMQGFDENLVPNGGRRLVISPVTKAEILKLTTFHEADKVGDQGTALRDGSLGRAFGFDIFMNQNLVQTFSPGSFAGSASATAAGLTTVAYTGGTGTGNVGDIITIATSPGTYVLTAAASGATGNISIDPPLRSTLAGSNAIAVVTGWGSGTTVRGLAFHQDAYAFASRPLNTSLTPGVIVQTSADPISGLSLRLTVEYVSKQVVWSLDILYGGAVVEGARIGMLWT